MRQLLLALGLSAILSGSAYSEDSLKPGDLIAAGLVAAGGIICNTEAEVREAYSHWGEKNYTFPSGCGRLVRPFPAQVFHVEYFTAKGLKFTLGRFEFTTGETQYGIWGALESLGNPA